MKQSIRIGLWVMLGVLGLPHQIWSQAGKDGAFVSNGGTSFVNEFTTLTTDALAGNTVLQVGNSGLNFNGRFPANLAPGDLIMVIQVQGATLDGTNSPVFGSILNYNNCGRYEVLEVAAVPSATSIQLCCALQNDYTAAGRVQIVRMPRYASLTLNGAATLTTDNWTGVTGGILAVEVQGNTVLNGSSQLNVNGRGFRGGVLENDNSPFTVTLFRSPVQDDGAEKGESIGGYQADYNVLGGRYCRGAVANGGGGGNAHNAGGGGGANGGDPALWNGLGNPSLATANWAQAWNLEGAGFATNISSGGGRGGYSFSSNNGNALTQAPGNAAWAGDNRDNIGGFGGRPLDYTTGRIFLGGGGGAGDQNNNAGGAGGRGGGLIYVLSYGDVTGTGSINAFGANGASTTGGGNDGPGGGGSGGTILVQATGAVSGITLNASGGNGGNQLIGGNEAEGPGGGGGGGYIAITNGAPTRIAAGGTHGTTNSPALTEFPPNGATEGGGGTPSANLTTNSFSATGVTICSGETATLTGTLTGTFPPGTQLVWQDAATCGNVLGNGGSLTTPALYDTTTYWVGPCPGTYRIPVTVIVHPVPATSISGPTVVCDGSSQTYTAPAVAGHTYAWTTTNGSISSGQGSNSVNVAWGTPGTGSLALTQTTALGCDTTVVLNVSIGNIPAPVITGPTTHCPVSTAAVNYSVANTPGNTYAWTIANGSIAGGTGTNAVSVQWGTTGPGTLTVTETTPNGCVSSTTLNISFFTTPDPAISGLDSLCAGATGVNYTTTATAGATWTWAVTGGTITGGQGTSAITVDWNAAGTGTVTLTESTGPGCSVTGTFDVDIYPLPTPTITGPTGICAQSSTVPYSTPANAGSSYTWTVTGGTIVGGQGSNAISVDWPSGTTGTVAVTETNSFGCSETVSLPVSVFFLPQPFIFGNNPVCEFDGPFNYNTNNTPGSSFNWSVSGGSILSGNGTAFIDVGWSAAGTGTVTVVETDANGCIDTTSFTVNVTPKPTPDLNGPDTVCQFSPASTYTTPNNPGSIYNWAVGGGIITSTAPGNSITVDWVGLGPWTVAVTEVNALGCDSTDIFSVTVLPTPTPFLLGPTQACLGDIRTYFTPVNPTPGNTYNWAVSGGNIVSGAGSNSIDVLWGTVGPGTVTLTETHPQGCDSTLVRNVTVNPLPAPVINGPAQVCEFEGGSVYSTGTPGPTYVWQVTGGTVTGGQGSNAITVAWGAAGLGTVSLAETNGFGCDSAVTIPVDIQSKPTPVINGPGTVCERTGNHIYSTTSTGSLNWGITGGWVVSGQGTPTLTVHWGGAGSGLLTLQEVGANGCDSTVQYPVTVVARPAPVFEGPGVVCEGNLGSIYSVPPVNGGNYTWTVTGGNLASGQGTNAITVDWPVAGSGTVELVVENAAGCDSSWSQAVLVQPLPSGVLLPDSARGCAVLTVAFEPAVSGNTADIRWDFGDGGLSNGLAAVHDYQQAGNYNVTATLISDAGCRADLNGFVVVDPKPEADFEFQTATGEDILQMPFDSLFLLNTSNGATLYNWDFGDGTTRSDFEPAHTYAEPGIYIVGLTVENDFGCTDSAFRSLTVEAALVWYIPSAFTPNDDLVNDIFEISHFNISDFHIMIFDRWGAMIFESFEPDFKWDGSYRGQPAPEGVYTAVLSARTLDGEQVKRSATVTLYR